MTAKTTAEALFNNFITYYGIPSRIHSDQGANFESQIIKELCQITGIKKSRTTSYHAMGNGQCERYNRTLLDMLGTLRPNQKQNWKLYINPLVHAYNCTRNESTGLSPYFLMFGRNPRLAIDDEFGINKTEWKSTSKYINDLKENMKAAYELVNKNTKRAQEKQKEGYDQRVRGAEIRTGDRVLVKIVTFDGKHKISDKWEDEPYIVLDQLDLSIPVFQIQKETTKGKIRTLHRNLLLPISQLNFYKTHKELEESKEIEKPKPKPRTRARKQKKETEDVHIDTSYRYEDTSSDEEIEIIRHVPVYRDEMQGNVVHRDVHRDDVHRNDVHRDDVQRVNHEAYHDGSIRERGNEAEKVPHAEIPEQHPQQDAEVEEDDGVTQNEEREIPRRSSRKKKKPAWMNNQEYIFSQQHSLEWMRKCQFLDDLKKSQEMKKYEDQIVQTMLDILKNN